ncbi:MAG: Alanine--tRNA ligase [Candidatus Heimdallarchaeota archaeon LC_3]|nr:MAG: Alanine--tRNA ligase [Candidatus Heimdallarchaeota archaeon LC_3]OLS21041.1 MAG: Alanine--tRNA ligase [Candidatus Heimdallarchaeota archaeon LC_3]
MCIPKPYWIDPDLSDFEIEIIKVENGSFFTKESLPMFLGGGGQPPDEAILILDSKTSFTVKNPLEYSFKLKEKVQKEDQLSLPFKGKLEINLNLRRAYMRAHTSQHVVSAIIKKNFDIDTSKAVLEDDESKLILNKKLSINQLNLVLTEFYRIMNQDLDIKTRVIKKGQNKDINGNSVDLGLIRGDIPSKEECIRLVEIDGVDLNTCGGTHLLKTSEALSIVFTELKKDIITFKVGYKAIQIMKDNQEFHVNLINKLTLPYKKISERTLEIVNSYPKIQKLNFDLSKTFLKSILFLIKENFSKEVSPDFEIKQGSFTDEPLKKQNLPIEAKIYGKTLIILMKLSFMNRATFISSIIDFSFPTVLIAEIEKKNLICQSNKETIFSAKEFLDKLVKRSCVKGGGSDKQIQCSIKEVENVFGIIKSILENKN